MASAILACFTLNLFHMKKLCFMMPVIAVIMLMAYSNADGQDTIRASVYFDYAKSELLPSAKATLDSLEKVIKRSELNLMRITGNTDLHGSYDYNRRLSENRSQAVYEYLAGSGINTEKVEILAQGKSLPKVNGSDEAARASNRRVDIMALVLPKKAPGKQSSLTRAIKNNARAENQPLVSGQAKEDVRLTIPEGAFYPYQNQEVEISYTNRSDMDKLAREGFTTMTTDGEVLASAGVFCLRGKLKNGEALTDSFRLSQAVEVYLPVTNCACIPENIRLWSSIYNESKQVVWSGLRDSVRLVRENTRQYYVFKVSSLACVNLDCIQKTAPLEMAVRKYEPVAIKLVYPRSKAIVVGKVTKKGIVTIPAIRTNENPKVYAVVQDHHGVQYQINGKKLGSLSRNLFSQRIVLRKSDFKKIPPARLKKVDREQVTFGYVEPGK